MSMIPFTRRLKLNLQSLGALLLTRLLSHARAVRDMG